VLLSLLNLLGEHISGLCWEILGISHTGKTDLFPKKAVRGGIGLPCALADVTELIPCSTLRIPRIDRSVIVCATPPSPTLTQPGFPSSLPHRRKPNPDHLFRRPHTLAHTKYSPSRAALNTCPATDTGEPRRRDLSSQSDPRAASPSTIWLD
jgi:hypothetical protein